MHATLIRSLRVSAIFFFLMRNAVFSSCISICDNSTIVATIDEEQLILEAGKYVHYTKIILCNRLIVFPDRKTEGCIAAEFIISDTDVSGEKNLSYMWMWFDCHGKYYENARSAVFGNEIIPSNPAISASPSIIRKDK